MTERLQMYANSIMSASAPGYKMQIVKNPENCHF